jgi:hypothetical protein
MHVSNVAVSYSMNSLARGSKNKTGILRTLDNENGTEGKGFVNVKPQFILEREEKLSLSMYTLLHVSLFILDLVIEE